MKTSFENSFVYCIDKLDIMKKLLLFLLLVPMVSFGQTATDLNTSGNTKLNLEDYYGAIEDYSKAIELDPDDADAYYNRGVAKKKLKDYYGAINDYSKAIELKPDYADAYVNRGISKEDLGDLNGACADWKKAASLGHQNSAQWVRDQCN